MFSVFDTTTLPDEIHLSKLSVWISSQKGAETSAVKAKETSEGIRLEVEESLKAAVQEMAIPLSSDIAIASSLNVVLEPVSFKPKRLFTYYDYQECLTTIAKASGSKGEKNMFGAYTYPCLVTVSTALTKWETNNLHLLSSSESLTKLVQLIYPSLKRNVDKLHSRSEELTRQISEHDRLTQNYNKKCQELCQQWGVSIDYTNTDNTSTSSCSSSSSSSSSSSNSNSSSNSSSSSSSSRSRDCINSCRSSEGSVAVADSLRRQLDTLASPSYRKSIFESKLLLHQNQTQTAASSPSSACHTMSPLPLLQRALRAGNTLTDAHVAQLFQNKSPPLPPPHKNASSSSLDSSGSGDEWTHVSVSDIAGSGVETATVTEAVTGSLPPIEVQMEDMLTPETQDALMQEVMLLKGFFLSQAAGAGTGAGVAKAGSISVSVSVSTSPEMKQQQQPQQQGLGTGGEECTYSPASPSFLLSSASVLQVVLEVFSSDEVLNMRALENNPTYLSRIHQEISLNHNKYVLFGNMAKREMQERADLKDELMKMKQNLLAVKENIFSLKSCLECSLTALFAPSSVSASLGKTAGSGGGTTGAVVTIVGDDFDLIVQ